MSLPSGYKKLEYIQSSGTQYIDTGFKPTQTSRVTMDVVPLSVGTEQNGGGFFFGSCYPIQQSGIEAYIYSGVICAVCNGTQKTDTQQQTAGTRYAIDFNGTSYSFTGSDGYTFSGSFSSTTFTSPVNLALLALPRSGAYYGACKLYGCKIYSSGTLVRDFIPCKNASGTVGLWDDANSVFYQNAGTGSFTAGPEVYTTGSVLINGTAYSITGGRTLIGGTGYGISKGRTLIGGTGYDISFATSSPLSDFTPGSIVKLNESGSPVEFYVAKHDYESGLNGTGRTLLVRKDVYSDVIWDSNNTNKYMTSNIHTWLTGTYKGLLDTAIQTAITPASGHMAIPCILGGGSTGGIYLYADVFLLSVTELGKTDLGSDYDGTTLGIASALQTVYMNGSTTSQWTRTPYSGNTTNVYFIYKDAWMGHIACGNAYGARPCFTLPGTTLVDADNNVIV